MHYLKIKKRLLAVNNFSFYFCLVVILTTLSVEAQQDETFTNYPQGSNHTMDVIAKDTIYDIRISPIYNSERKKIVFNITWNKPKNITIFSYKFKLSSNCTYSSFETSIDENYNSTEILIPPLLYPHQIYPACTYEIKITTYSEESGEKVIDHIYTVPECVGPKCSCTHLTPQFKTFKAYEFAPGKLNITWEIDRTNSNQKVYEITSKMFEYRQLKTERLHANPFKKISSFNAQNNFLLLDDTHFFTSHLQYELRATFNNSFNCKTYNYTNITMMRPVLVEEEPKQNSQLFLVFVILFPIALLLLASFILKRSCFKEEVIIKDVIRKFWFVSILRRDYVGGNRRNSYAMVSTIATINARGRHIDNLLYVDKEIIEGNVDRYEFPRSRLNFKRKIGGGAFGQVFLAEAFGVENKPTITYVAVKQLNEGTDSEELDNFLSEIEILKKIGQHPNIVKMFGCCVLKEPCLMIMEYVPCGDLLNYLLDLRKKWQRKRLHSNTSSILSNDGTYIVPDNSTSISTSSSGGERPYISESEYKNTLMPSEIDALKIEGDLSHTELQQFALQIAKGMEHLEKIPIAHRDLAARNILINEYKVLKISDFGLSRAGPYVNSRTQKMPLRWVSIEAIEDRFYDSKGDVWSFAVVLWEIGTLGAFPYENITNSMVPQYLASGKRLARPEICTDKLYALMLSCWSRDPKLRPSFKELVDLLDVKKTRVYVDFNQLNPMYMFPPSNNSYVNCS